MYRYSPHFSFMVNSLISSSLNPRLSISMNDVINNIRDNVYDDGLNTFAEDVKRIYK